MLLHCGVAGESFRAAGAREARGQARSAGRRHQQLRAKGEHVSQLVITCFTHYCVCIVKVKKVQFAKRYCNFCNQTGHTEDFCFTKKSKGGSSKGGGKGRFASKVCA